MLIAGTYQDDIKAEGGVEAIAASAGAAPADGAAPAPAADGSVDPATLVFEEPETEEMIKAREEEEADAKKMTFDQWKVAQEAKKVADDAKLQVRKVENDEKKFKASGAFQREETVMFDDTGKPNAKPAEKKADAKNADKKGM